MGGKHMKKVLLFTILSLLFIPFCNVEAKTLQDLYNELDTLEKKRDAASSNQKLTESEIPRLNNEITLLKVKMKSKQKEKKPMNF